MSTEPDKQKEEALLAISTQWRPVNAEQEQLLRDNMSIHVFKKNEVIFSGSEDPHHMFYIIKGKVKIYKDGIGRCQIIRAIKPVDPFGYRAFFAGQNYQTSAMALEDSLVARIPFEVVTQIMRTNYEFCLSFINHLAKELGKSDTSIINLTQKHIRGRLAETLILLKECYGVDADGHTLNIHLSREDLANMSNMTTNNAIRTLSAFANEHLVGIDGRKISILDEAGLQKVSDAG